MSLCLLSDVLCENTSARLHVFQGSYLGNEVSRVKSLVKTRGIYRDLWEKRVSLLRVLCR